MKITDYPSENLELDEAFQSARRMIEDGQADELRQLLQQYPALARWRDHPDSRGMQHTLLHEVTGMASVEWPEQASEIAQLLIEFGAEVDSCEQLNKGETPLHQAVSVNNVEVARTLLMNGADPERRGRYNSTVDTALGYALFYGADEHLPRFPVNCPQLLLQFDARVHLPFAAALNRIQKVRQLLIRIGDPPHPEDQLLLQQALLFAGKYGRIEMAELLLEHQADINATIPFFHLQATALHLACEANQRTEMVAFLLKRGADPTIRDGVYDATPLGWAMFCGQDKVYKLLRRYA